jgi:hypothetical protein
MVVVVMNVEQSMESLAWGSEVFGENLPRCRFVHHKTHTT